MEYLVLTQFSTFGVLLKKGAVVDESKIRSPRLRVSEGKIIPAVSSFNVPAESAPSGQASLDGLGSEDKKPEGEPDKKPDGEPNKEPEGEPKKEPEGESAKEPEKPLTLKLKL